MPTPEALVISEETEMPKPVGPDMPKPETFTIFVITEMPKPDTVTIFERTEMSKPDTVTNFEGTEMTKL